IAAGSVATIVQGNTFDGTGTAANGVYPIIDVAPNATDFTISSNQSRSFYPSTNWPSYGVRIAAGRSTRFFVNDNNFQQTKLGSVRNGAGAGGVYNVATNIP
ncbi:MAG: hypothetical protein ACRD4F_12630, partial [Candidatus Angelobacter sp.]